MKKKVIAEWLGELKLTEKKIKKTYDELSKRNMFIVENLQDSELYKEKLEEEKKEIKSSYESLNKLIENRNKIKSAIMSFNASNTIEIDDKEYVIALALELYKGKEIVNIEELFKNQLYKKNKKEEEIKQQKENQKEMLLETYSRKSNSSHEGDSKALEKALKNYELYTDDYLQLDKKFVKIQEEKISFMEKINIQLNIKNAITEIEIDI